MRIRKIRAKNFLSISESPLELDFTELGPIINVRGINLDSKKKSQDTGSEDAFSNGSGKSSISEILVYGLYGKTIRNLSHQEVINKKSKKGLEVEIKFDDYRVVRKRKPDSLRFYNNNKELTLGSSLATQKLIEDTIGLNFKAFINIVCFGQHNEYNFLSCSAADKRQIVENILTLEKYSVYFDKAKKSRRKIVGDIKDFTKDYENLVSNKENCERRIEQIKKQKSQWESKKSDEIQDLKNFLKDKIKEWESSDEASALKQYDEVQEKLNNKKEKYQALNELKVQLNEAAGKRKEKLNKISEEYQETEMVAKQYLHNMQQHKNDIKMIVADLEPLKKLEDGVKCHLCLGTVDKKNYKHILMHKENKMSSLEGKIRAGENNLRVLKEKLCGFREEIEKTKRLLEIASQKNEKLKEKLETLDYEIADLKNIEKPILGHQNVILRDQIKIMQKQLLDKEEELNNDPYDEILKSAISELKKSELSIKECEKKLDSMSKVLPYHTFWVEAFDNDGIRSFLIEEMIPSLNSRIDYWLQFLIDNRITVKFDSKLQETIERNPPDGDPFVYNATCGGERKRIDLSISQSFAYVTMLTSGTWPSLVILDEVGTNIDQDGISGIYKMIHELSRNRQVMVITHDAGLLEMMEFADILRIKKQNGSTEIITENM